MKTFLAILGGSLLLRFAFMALGLLLVAVGFVGVLLPGVPTTGPLVMAAACFTRSSPRLEKWVLDLPVVGNFIKDYRAGRGMPLQAKVVALSLMAAAGSYSVFFAVEILWVKTVIAALLGIGAAYILFKVPTDSRKKTKTRELL